MATTLFHGRRFYLTRTIAPQQRQQVRELIEVRSVSVIVCCSKADASEKCRSAAAR